LNLTQIHIHNLRIFSKLEFQPDPGINLITGANGVGKTTILEAIYLLARAKSFRTSSTSSLIRQGENDLLLRAKMQGRDGVTQTVALQKSHNRTLVKVSGTSLKRLSTLARRLPLGLATASIHKLLEEGPGQRRKFINWGVFHVEPGYSRLMTDFQRLLAQRNYSLRHASHETHIWDRQFVNCSDQITLARENYIVLFRNYLLRLIESFSFLENLRIDFYPGYKTQEGLQLDLTERSKSDIRQGYTSVGPHRCDIRIKLGKMPAAQSLSRGQQKILCLLMFIAQYQLLESVMGEKPIILIDDLQAELDSQSIHKILQIISDLDYQTFITSLEAGLQLSVKKVFHVEHGRIAQLET